MSPPVNGLLVQTPLELQPWSDWQPVAACMHETPTYLEWQRQTGSALPTTAPVRREGEKKGEDVGVSNFWIQFPIRKRSLIGSLLLIENTSKRT